MRIGLFGITLGPGARAATCTRLGALAEELGYDSVWAPEHAVLPTPRSDRTPLYPTHPILDPLVALAAIAAVTTRITLATGVILLPQHQPVLLGKQLVSLDQLSSGRVVLGVGVGYLAAELRAAGVDMADRGALTDEHLAALRSLWSEDPPQHQGKTVDLRGLDAHPRPVRGTIPVVVGGDSPAALRRTVRHGNGWYGFNLDRAATATRLAALRAAADAADRPFADLEISVTPTEPLRPEVVADYAELGVHRLVAMPRRAAFWKPDAALDDLEQFVHANAPADIGGAPAR